MNNRRTSIATVLTVALALATAVGTGTTTAAGSPAAETTPPAPPINVEVTEIGWQQVTVTWEHGSSETPWMYHIDNLTNGDVKAVSGTSTEAQLIGLDPEQTYRLEVRAVDVYSWSEPVEVTATTVAMPHVDPPSDLEVVNVAWNGVDLAWEPSPEGDLWSYQIVYLDREDGYYEAVDATRTTAHIELRPEQTYRFAVRAAKEQIDFQQVHSELTNEVTVTTPEQFIEPPTNLQAVRDGRSVTLTWQRPDQLEFPDAAVEYLVYDGDVLETVLVEPEALTQTIPRVSSGEHAFTVRMRYHRQDLYGEGVSAPSNPATVNVPSADDTTPPTPPDHFFVVFHCATNQESYELRGASDDTSPPEQIQYEAIRLDWRQSGDPIYVPPDGYDVPRTGVLPHPHINRYFGGQFRAVDEAGNRSEVVDVWVHQEIIC